MVRCMEDRFGLVQFGLVHGLKDNSPILKITRPRAHHVQKENVARAKATLGCRDMYHLLLAVDRPLQQRRGKLFQASGH